MARDMSDEKSVLRQRLREQRALEFRQLPKAGMALAMRAPAALLEGVGGKWVAGYVPQDHEIEPGGLMHLFRQQGARLCLPMIAVKEAPLSFRAWDFGQKLEEGIFGTRQPVATQMSVTPDILLVPLLGFDRFGHRIGYGGGYYDRTLADLRAVHDVLAIGLAFEGQRVDALPREPHDEPLDWIVTENAAYRAVEPVGADAGNLT